MTPDLTLRPVFLVRCWTCEWQATYAKEGHAKAQKTLHARRCPGLRRSWSAR